MDYLVPRPRPAFCHLGLGTRLRMYTVRVLTTMLLDMKIDVLREEYRVYSNLYNGKLRG